MTITPAQAVAQVDSPRHEWDELSDQYKRHCREIAAAAIAAHRVLEADVPLAQPEHMPPAPSYWPERDGTLGEVEVGDRVMWGGVWREVEVIRRCNANHDEFVFTDDDSGCYSDDTLARIQKRVATTEAPPQEMRLPGGDVAYQTVRAGEVVPGMWVEVDGAWRQVVGVPPTAIGGVLLMFGDADNQHHLVDEKVKVASTVDGARLAAERKAQQAEAYDQACEAR